MQEWLRRRWAVIWRLIGGVSLRVKIMGIALAMIALLGLGLTWQVRVTMARALTEELERHQQRLVEQKRNTEHEVQRKMVLEFLDVYDRLAAGAAVLTKYKPVNSLFSHSPYLPFLLF